MSNAAKPTLAQVLEFIHNAPKEERNAIGRALSACRNDDILTARMEYRVGEKVKFEPRKRGYPRFIYGTISQKNIKTFVIRPESGDRDWKVTASLVQKDDRLPK
jgi:hypothetical protein